MDIEKSDELPSHHEISVTKDMSEVVSETAAKLALQSAEDNLHSRTGRQLKRFSEQLTKKLATNEFKKDRNKGKGVFDSKIDPKIPLKRLMEMKDKEYELKIHEIKGEHQRDTEILIKPIEDYQSIQSIEMGSQILRANSEPKPAPEETNIESLDWNQLMVEIRSLNFSYKRKQKFMHNLNMSVPKSSIYGLLGPSGCGKTTLLKLILGLMRAKSGLIKVNGKRPGDPKNNIPGTGVGFMPQELALYQEFTLSEALRYFSRIYGMSDEQIVLRTKFLVDFLDLPDPDRPISNMSGGQKRRVSLALSLVHNPPLLILDEPTVGTDPVLRERIWEHLIVLSRKESTTIIITTHYIEEARRAHVVSLMRKGELLVEHSPQFLMNYLNAENLEEVFLRFCSDNPNKARHMPKNYLDTNVNNNNNNHQKSVTVDKTKNPLNIDSNWVKTNRVSSQKRIRNQTNKNYIRLIRNKPLLIFETILPTFCIIIFFLCIGTKPFGLKIAVFNEEYVESLMTNDKNKTGPLSQYFLKAVDNKTIFFKHFDTKESAIQSVVDNNEIYGALIFKKYFSPCLGKRLQLLTRVSEEDIENSTALFYADFTDMVVTQTITRALIEAQIKFFRIMFVEAINGSGQIQDRFFDPILKFVDPPIYGNIDPQFRDFITPGIVLTVIFMMAMGLTALTLVVERKEGTMERTLVAGVQQYEILLSQVILQFIIVIFQTALLLIFMFIVFHAPLRGNFGLIIFIILLQGLTGMCFGLLISSMSSDENSAIMMTLGSFYPMFLISGIIWPLEGMPYGLRLFSYFLPQTLPILSLRNIMLKGWFIDHTFVYLGFVSSIVWLIIFLLLAALVLKIRENPYFHHLFNKQ